MRNSITGNSNIYLLILMISILSISCKKNEVLVGNQSVDLSFFPVHTGYWTEYEVDSTVHYDSDDIFEVDTDIGYFHFFVREEFDLPFVNGENQNTAVINRYRRDNDTLPWTYMNKWTANVDPYSAQKVEDNVRFVRLSFPIKSNASWNGNAYNFFSEEEYSYEDLYEPMTFGNLHFDSTVTVLQNDFTSRINKIYKKEIYAAHAGLVYKQLDSVNTKMTNSGTIILTGLEYKLTLLNYNH
jgi:hypothetical protein